MMKKNSFFMEQTNKQGAYGQQLSFILAASS
jgi:hypothetical protein